MSILKRRYVAAPLAAFVLALAVASCAPGSDLPKLQSTGVTSDYRLSAGDQVRLTTFGEPTLTGTFAVDDSGHVALPLIGPLPADGRTTSALADEIVAALRSKNLIGDPSVVAEVATYRPIFVLGEVQKPGQYPFIPHMTMLNAVALAGGFTPRAVTVRASVLRTGPEGSLESQASRDSKIEPGDTVTVFERLF